MTLLTAHRARWGLLATTLFMALALVGTGLSSYLGAKRAAQELLGARALDLGMLVRRSLRFTQMDETALAAFVEETSDRGLRGVAIVAPGAPHDLMVGIRTDVARRIARRCRPPHGPSWLEMDGLLLVSQPLHPRHGHQGGRGWGRRQGPGSPPAPDCLILALDPAAATPVAARAGMTLFASVVAAALLLGVALVFWRASRRAELLASELARDRQLKALGEMSAVLGHEVRNPLASLKGHAQLLLEKISSEHAARRGAERVVDEAKRLEQLTHEVLEFARTAQLDLLSADPLVVARASADAVADARVELVADSPPHTCRLDVHRMQQVLENVLRNALQASAADGRVTLRVAGRSDRVLFSVRDRGSGIEDGDTERIFEPFVSNKARGTGLGLALAKRIVDGHGGTIEARNHPDGGVEVTITLPVAPASSGD